MALLLCRVALRMKLDQGHQLVVTIVTLASILRRRNVSFYNEEVVTARLDNLCTVVFSHRRWEEETYYVDLMQRSDNQKLLLCWTDLREEFLPEHYNNYLFFLHILVICTSYLDLFRSSNNPIHEASRKMVTTFIG